MEEHTIDVARTLTEEGNGSYEIIEVNVIDRELVSELVADAASSVKATTSPVTPRRPRCGQC